MECHYHPGREATDSCAICGKSVCKECGLQLAGKIYCKECLEKIVGLSLDNSEPKQEAPKEEPSVYEPREVPKPVQNEAIYEPQEEFKYEAKSQQNDYENQAVDNSPYNITPNVDKAVINNYSRPAPETQADFTPAQSVEVPKRPAPQEDDFIYPEHSYQPQERSSSSLEDKYERYLDDLYFDEEEVPLSDQLAKDEEKYGSITRREYKPRPQEALIKEKENAELEAKIREDLQNGGSETGPIHNLNYQDEKEPMSVVDIILILVLILVIALVLYYIAYLFFLNVTYPTFMDALFALKNPQNVINSVMQK